MLCFPNRGPRGTWPFVFHQLCMYMLVDKTTFERNSAYRVLSHNLYLENETYELKRSIYAIVHNAGKYITS